MLTKDLIRVTTKDGIIRPKLLQISNDKVLELATSLISIFSENEQETREQIEELSDPIIKSFQDINLAKGFYKILLDRSKFEVENRDSFPEWRRESFEKSFTWIKNSQPDSEYSSFTQSMREVVEVANIYADLPSNERLVKFNSLSPTDLIKRYNLSLVQSVLLFCDSIVLKFHACEAKQFRRFFKYLKFFRLLALLEKKSNQGREEYRLTINGPLSVVDSSQKYGFQLACFFPAICQLKLWSLVAQVKWKRRKYQLKLSAKDNLESNFFHFNAYVPKEIELFIENFKAQEKNWTVNESPPPLLIGDQNWILPDFEFKNKQGEVFFLELFHRWHAKSLSQRLSQLKTMDTLILGVDRSLVKKARIKSRLEKHRQFQKQGFLYRDFPSIEKLLKLLQSLESFTLRS